jgi:hypothetical protein
LQCRLQLSLKKNLSLNSSDWARTNLYYKYLLLVYAIYVLIITLFFPPKMGS